MQQNIAKIIFCTLSIIFLFPTLAIAQTKQTQFAIFHGFDHRNNNIIHWQWGKIMTVDNQGVHSNAPWYARDIWGRCEGTFDPIQIPPGTHILGVSSAYSYGFMQGPYTGNAQFKVKLSPGQHYFLNGSIVAERTIRLWIEDAKGRAVSSVVTAFGNYHSEAPTYLLFTPKMK